MDICSTHSLGGGYVCLCVYMFNPHDTPHLSGPSKALSGALCGPRSLPFHSASFCLSVSYLIELARKQSKWRYLRLRAKPHWCPSEVPPRSVRVCAQRSHDPFKRIHEQHIKGHHSQWCPPYSVRTLCLLRHSPTHTHARPLAFKQVSWPISDAHSECQTETKN